MRSGFVFAVFILILGFSLPSCGQQSASSNAVADAQLGDLGTGAILKFDTLQHAFGKVQSGEEVACRFGFTNTGTAPLLIREVKAGCGCTNVEYPQQPVKPGERGTVEITFDTRGRNGIQHQNVVVLSNGEEQSILLSITAQVE